MRVPPPIDGAEVTSLEYDARAAVTDEDAKGGSDPYALSVPVLGLAGEVGTLLVAQKKEYRDQDMKASDRSFLTDELGDVLWYAVTVARHAQLPLDALLDGALLAVRERAETARLLRNLPTDLPRLDEAFEPIERLPRRIVFRFREQGVGTVPTVDVTLVEADPNPFADGPITHCGKLHRYAVNHSFGDPLDDNSRRSDGYRYHDAIHIGFLAVMGWSPVIRGLLKVKRRSDSIFDINEDGARATFAEEGLAAILAKRAPRFQNFATEAAIDDDSVELMVTVLADLEVGAMPSWLWRRAICQGFAAMRHLIDARGGFLLVDLDTRSVTHSLVPPRL